MTSNAALTDYSGFTVPEKEGHYRLRLAVEGMHCAGCAFKIEKAFSAIPHVDARVNVTEKRLSLVWKGNVTDGNNLVARIEGLGFRFSPLQENDQSHNSEIKKLLRAMAVAGFASGNIMIFSLAVWFTGKEEMGAATRDLLHWFSAAIALPTAVYAGRPFYASAFRALSHGRTNMDVPISVGVTLALGMSVFELLHSGAHVYFDSVAMLLFLLLVGRYLDARARGQAKTAATNLLSAMRGIATISRNGIQMRIPAGEIKAEDLLFVARGEKVFADGTLSSDVILADTSAITGETQPRFFTSGDFVFAGTINIGDPVQIKVERPQRESLMQDILLLMEKASQGHARYVRLADRVSSFYTPVVHLLALATFGAWFWGAGVSWQEALLYAVTVLIITCPCALGLAVPVVQVIASQRLFKSGALLKSADALEKLAEVDTVVFDKTGTLTTGQMVFINKDDFSDAEKTIMASLAAQSRHPLSRFIAELTDRPMPVSDVKERPGAGLVGIVAGKKTWLGSAAFTGGEADVASLWFKQSDQPAKPIFLSDVAHQDAVQTIKMLQREYDVVLLSGDTEDATCKCADDLSIPSFKGNLLPQQKFDAIEGLAAQGKKILMVGDGLNDAPSLMRGHVSMSPSSALHITQNAADIVYQSKGISAVLQALHIAKTTRRLVRQNFAMSFIYNALAVPLAMMGYVTPLIAAAAMSFSSLAVVMNALRLYREKI